MVGDHNCRPIMRLPKLAANECKIEPVFSRRMPGHEAAVVTALLPIPNEAVVVQLLPGKDHRRLGRAEKAIVRPKRAADKADTLDDYRSAMQQMDTGRPPADRGMENRLQHPTAPYQPRWPHPERVCNPDPQGPKRERSPVMNEGK